MWLIDTSTLQLTQVADENVHPFAILSHTWEAGQEVGFQEMQNIKDETITHKSGFQKISRTCHIARRNYKYVWIDTCCIDKTSSSELSEAINSMFRFYQAARVCYVYLPDFEPLPLGQLRERGRMTIVAERLKRCKWFTRGWTLQELIASRVIEFLDRDWNFQGTKSDLMGPLSKITNIDESVLTESSVLHTVPVARRMSWASQRETTRVEDLAYCLLGIFDINMPMLYGEGSRAFLRLQQAIAGENLDLSLFAWQSSAKDDVSYSGIFAQSPRDFAHCGSIKTHQTSFNAITKMSITNTGIRLTGHIPHIVGNSPDAVLNLDCLRTAHDGSTEWIGIYLTRTGQTFVRQNPSKVATTAALGLWQPAKTIQKIYVRPRLLKHEMQRISALSDNTIIIQHDLSERLADVGLQVKGSKGTPESEYMRTGPKVNPADRGGTSMKLSYHAWNTWREERDHPDGGAIFSGAAEGFLGIHEVELDNNSLTDARDGRPVDRFWLLVALQWNGSALSLTYGLYLGLDVVEGMSENECLDNVRRHLLATCSDLTGLMKQDMMPVELTLYGPTSLFRPEIRITVRTDDQSGSNAAGLFRLYIKADHPAPRIVARQSVDVVNQTPVFQVDSSPATGAVGSIPDILVSLAATEDGEPSVTIAIEPEQIGS